MQLITHPHHGIDFLNCGSLRGSECPECFRALTVTVDALATLLYFLSLCLPYPTSNVTCAFMSAAMASLKPSRARARAGKRSPVIPPHNIESLQTKLMDINIPSNPQHGEWAIQGRGALILTTVRLIVGTLVAPSLSLSPRPTGWFMRRPYLRSRNPFLL